MKIELKLGVRIIQDGSHYTVSKVSEHIDSDLGCGPILNVTTVEMTRDDGFKTKIILESCDSSIT